MDSYELDKDYLRLSRQFAELCVNRSAIEKSLSNGMPNNDRPELEARLAGLRKQLEVVRRNLEQAS